MFYFICATLIVSMVLSVPIKMEQQKTDPKCIWKCNLENYNLFEDA